jgi:hypothetical protein
VLARPRRNVTTGIMVDIDPPTYTAAMQGGAEFLYSILSPVAITYHTLISSTMSQNHTGVSVVMNQMLRKEKEYRQGIEWNYMQCIGFAPRLAHGGAFETLLGEETMQQYRESLKQLAQDNIVNDRQLRAYLNAVQALGNDPEAMMDKDNQAKLERTVDEERSKLEKDSILITQESSYLELCHKLGEQQANEDDDLAVLPTENTTSLKCPLTATFMEDPVKNKVCKHSYSRNAILQHIRVNRKCPVPGCGNRNVTPAQLETDDYSAMLIRRAKKRQEMERRSQTQAAIDMDDDDD